MTMKASWMPANCWFSAPAIAPALISPASSVVVTSLCETSPIWPTRRPSSVIGRILLDLAAYDRTQHRPAAQLDPAAERPPSGEDVAALDGEVRVEAIAGEEAKRRVLRVQRLVDRLRYGTRFLGGHECSGCLRQDQRARYSRL
jgi:hypothetical protein